MHGNPKIAAAPSEDLGGLLGERNAFADDLVQHVQPFTAVWKERPRMPPRA